MQFIERTEEPESKNWSFEEIEKVMVGDVLIARCPITTAPFANFMSEIYSQGKRNQSYNNYIYALRQFGDYLADNRILIDNPASDLEICKVDKRDMSMERLTLGESIELLFAAAITDSINKVRNFTLVLMLLSSATRIGELNYLQENEIFNEKGILYCFGKSGSRIRFLTPGLQTCIERLLKEPARLKALEGCSKRYLFYSTKGGPLTTDEANDILKELALKAGITRDISTYWLRRTFATTLAQCGLSTRTIQIIFDHDKLKTTEGYIAEYLRYDLRNLLDNSVVHQKIIDVTRRSITLLN